MREPKDAWLSVEGDKSKGNRDSSSAVSSLNLTPSISTADETFCSEILQIENNDGQANELNGTGITLRLYNVGTVFIFYKRCLHCHIIVIL